MNTVEIFEVEDGYKVDAQNTDGTVFVDSFVLADDAFDNITGHVQEDGRTAYDAKEGYEFILEGEYRVGARIGTVHCVEEQDVREYEIPFENKYEWLGMVEELDVPANEQAYDALNFLPTVSLVVEYDATNGEATPTGVKIDGTLYELGSQKEL